MDHIKIRGISGHGFHGVLESERREGQSFIVDVDLDVDIAAAAASDDLAMTVDYSAVSEAVHSLIVGDSVLLIETLAQMCADACLGFEGVHSVTITVHKPHAPIAVPFDDVSVVITRVR